MAVEVAKFWAGNFLPLSFTDEVRFHNLNGDLGIQIVDGRLVVIEAEGLLFSVDGGETFVNEHEIQLMGGAPLDVTVRGDGGDGVLRLREVKP